MSIDSVDSRQDESAVDQPATATTYDAGPVGTWLSNHWSKVVISLFLVFYIYSVGFWLCPKARWRTALLQPIAPFLLFTGLWQEYRTFTPPPSENLYLEARIALSDGSTTTWNYPRMERLGFADRLVMERFRKVGHEHVASEDQVLLWPDFAIYVARQVHALGKMPSSVELLRYSAPIAAPVAKSPAVPDTSVPGTSASQAVPALNRQFAPTVIFTYQVRPEDLQ